MEDLQALYDIFYDDKQYTPNGVAFSAFCKLAYSKFLGLAKHLAIDEDMAICVMNDVLIKVLEMKKVKGDRIRSIEIWLSVALRRKTIDYIRSRKSGSNRITEPREDFDNQRMTKDEIAQIIYERDNIWIMNRFRQIMSVAELETFMLRNEGLSYSEISEQLFVSVEAVKKRLQSARSKIQNDKAISNYLSL